MTRRISCTAMTTSLTTTSQVATTARKDPRGWMGSRRAGCRRLAWLAALLMTAACGSTTVEGGAGAGGEAGGASMSCDDFADEPGATPVVVVVDNQSAEDVWLANPTCSPSEFTFTYGGEEQSQSHGDCSCEGLQTDSWACVFTCDGPQYTLTRIPAGAQHTWTWTGATHTPREMPLECYAVAASAGPSCGQVVPAPAGTHTIAVEVHTGVTCWAADGGDCTCTPASPDQSCWLQADELASTGQATLSADFDVPGDTTVTFTVQ